MLHFLVLISSIFLTSFSAWSQEVNPFNMGSLLDFAENEGVEIVDLRGTQKPLNLNYIVEKSFSTPTAVDLVNMHLQADGLSRVKKFLIIEDGRTPDEYSATMAAASAITNSYNELDKQKHAQVGYGIGLASTIAIRYQMDRVVEPKLADILSRALGTALSCASGAGKELFYDRGNANHTVDKRDAYATCAGGAGMMIVPIDIRLNML